MYSFAPFESSLRDPTRNPKLQTRNHYSLLSDSVGFALAAFRVWAPTVASATAMSVTTDMMNGMRPMLIWYAKPVSHSLITHHATGHAITKATTINRMNFDTARYMICTVSAPNILRMPISFKRWLNECVERP